MRINTFSIWSVLILLLVTTVSAASQGYEYVNKPEVPDEDAAMVRLAETKIGDSLIAKTASPQPVPVIISLASQPFFEIAQRVQGRYWAELRANEEAIRRINLKYTTNAKPRTPDEAAAAAAAESRAITAADKARIRQLNEESRDLKDRMGKEMLSEAKQAAAADHAAAFQLVTPHGGRVNYTFAIENSVAATVPGNAIPAIANSPLVRWVIEDELRAGHLNVSVPTISAGTFWAAGETGGIWWPAICDSGVDTAHPAFSSQAWWQGVFHATADDWSGYADNSSSTDDLQGHGSHVAGIVVSDDATNRGVSYGSTKATNLKAGFKGTDGKAHMYDSDGMASVHWGWTNANMDSINLSYGGDTTDDDNDYCRFWDAVVDAKTTDVIISAGNDGPNDSTLGSPGITYNSLTVAAIDDRGTTNRADDIVANFSSRGPTSNGRKKPDIAAPGVSIASANWDWEGTNSDFVNKNGTSMAAPHVCGAATLMHDVGVHDARAIKAILINTADFAPGQTTWQKDWGWGYLNLNRAYLRRTNYFLHSVNPRGSAGDFKLYKVPSGTTGDKATIAWNRHVAYNNASYPTTWHALNDLDVYSYRESNNTTLGSSASSKDNVEQVSCDNGGNSVVVRVRAWSTAFNGVSSETYGLAVPAGTVAASGPVLVPESSNYTPPVQAKFTVNARVSNSGDLAAHGCLLTLTLPSGVTLISGSLSNSIGTVEAGSSSSYVTLELKATTTGLKTVNMSVSSTSYAQTWTGSGSFTINPGPQDVTAPYTVMPISAPNYQTSAGTEKIANGGYESGAAGWVTSGAVATETGSAYSGTTNLKLGPGTGSAYQTLSLASNASPAILTFWYKSGASFLAGAGCSIQDSSGNTLVYPFSTTSSTSVWTKATIDVSRFAGQTIRVNFYSSSGFIGGTSTLWVDEVSVKEDSVVWVDDPTSLSLRFRDENSGIDYSQYYLDSWVTYSTPFNLAGRSEGVNYIYYRSIDNGGNYETSVSTYLYHDSRAPKSVLQIGSPLHVNGGTEKVTNGGFESGLGGWTTSGAVTTTSSTVHTGSLAAKIGGTGAGNIYRDIPINAGAGRAFLTFWIRADAGTDGSYTAYYVQDPATSLSCTAAGFTSLPSWTRRTFDVTAFKGASVRLRVEVFHTTGTAATAFLDDVSVVENATTYVMPSSSLTIRSAEGVGVETYERSIDGGGYIAGQTFSISGSGTHSVAYRATDYLAHQESAITTSLTVDDQGPTGSILIDSGAAYTTSTTVSLTLSASDPVGVSLMRIRSDTGVWGGWQAYASSLPYTFASSAEGAKTLAVEYQDIFGNVSATFTDSIQHLIPVEMTIPKVKKTADGKGVRVTGKVVTATFPDSGYFYIEESDRTGGIRVRTDATLPTVGATVDVDGVAQTIFAEREILATSLAVGRNAVVPAPLAMPNQSLGGGQFGYQSAIPPGAVGLNNIGLLVTTTGRVTRHLDGHFGIVDGSRLADYWGPDDPTLFVHGQNLGGWKPPVGSYVSVTGISGAETISGIPFRVLRPRSVDDIQIVQMKAAFIYNTSSADATSFKGLLDGQNISTDLVAYGNVTGTDFSQYHMILVGTDTGEWTDPGRVSRLVDSSKPVIGIGYGGAWFLERVGGLEIGWMDSASASQTDGIVVGGDIYIYPHDLGVVPGSSIQVYSVASTCYVVYDPSGATLTMLRLAGYSDYYVLAADGGRYYQWGFVNPPGTMTQTGKNLFVNLVFKAANP